MRPTASVDVPMAGVPARAMRPAPLRLLGHAAWFAPFVLIALAFLAAPAASLVAGSLSRPGGGLTLRYMAELLQSQYLSAYLTTIEVSALSAGLGGVVGLGLAWAVAAGGLPSSVRSALVTFSGVASNFAGVPLAFAFTSALGPVGMVTLFAAHHLGFFLYQNGFTLFGLWGLVLVYLYFQAPLMVLLVLPALEHAVRWREAAEILGASGWQYTWHVALPLLRGPVFGALLLLFGSGFGAYATAEALTSGMINLVPIIIGQEMSGNVLFNPALGDALAVGMVIVMAAAFAAAFLAQRGPRWAARA